MKEVTEKRGPLPAAFWEHLRAAREEMCAGWREILPASFWEHRRAARREALLAVRALIDAALEQLEGEEKPVTKVKVKA